LPGDWVSRRGRTQFLPRMKRKCMEIYLHKKPAWGIIDGHTLDRWSPLGFRGIGMMKLQA